MLGSPKYPGTNPAQLCAPWGKLLDLSISVSSAVKTEKGKIGMRWKARDTAEITIIAPGITGCSNKGCETNE